MKIILISGIMLFVLFSGTGLSQTIPFDSERWEFNAKEHRVEDYLGQKSLYLQGGLAIVKDSDFVNGIIEFDIAFSTDRGFMGAFWRLQDVTNYEEFYMRPHQSGKPDANQYTPVFNRLPGWQLYHGAGYGAAVKYNFNEWMHVRIVVSGKKAEVYIMDMEKPALVVSDLKHMQTAGKVGLSVSNFAPSHFANFRYVSVESPKLQGEPEKTEYKTDNNIMTWMVSNSFDEKSLEKKYHLRQEDKENLKWQKLTCEKSGLANLARVQGIKKDQNSVMARVVINSVSEQIKKLEFGYSDRIKVYMNDHLIYGGTNFYRSRDFRYLGTIGYFDYLYLPLKKGKNELWMAVSESFGGWGLQARFDDMNDITIDAE